MNVKKLIYDALVNAGCQVIENRPGGGITTVITPDGENWDFTEPQHSPSGAQKLLASYDTFVKDGYIVKAD